MSRFLDMTKDIVFKSLWLQGNDYVREYLERMIEYVLGHKLPKYNIGANEVGIKSYKDIANEVDILLVSEDHESKINIEMNRLTKNPSKNRINEVNNKSMIYLGNYINSYYNDLPKEDRYKGKVKVEQINFNNFYCEENKLISELHFELIDKNYDMTKYGIKIHQIYLPRMVELCYDKEKDVYKDFLLLMSKSYEEMDIIAKGNKTREEVVKFLRRLGADEGFMAVIDREEYNRILVETEIEEEKEASLAEGIQEGIEQGIEQKNKDAAINLHNNGVSNDIICKSLNINETQLQEYLKDQ